MLLIGAGLLLKSYEQLRSSNLGCVTDNVLTMRFTLPETAYSKPTQRVGFFENLLEGVRALPGIQAAGLVRAVPGQGYGGDTIRHCRRDKCNLQWSAGLILRTLQLLESRSFAGKPSTKRPDWTVRYRSLSAIRLRGNTFPMRIRLANI